MYQANFDLTGKVAVVTGGSRGIGRAIAEGLAHAGADVVLTARTEDEVTTAAKEIAGETGRRALGQVLDVTSTSSIDSFVSHCFSCHGEVGSH